MKLNYTLDEKDYVEYNIFHYKGSKMLKDQILALRFLVPILFLAICFLAKLDLFGYCFAIVISIVFDIFIPKMVLRGIAKNAKKMLSSGGKSDICGEYTLELNDEGIVGAIAGRTTHVKWSSIEKIASDDERIYIYICNLQAFIVPLSVFKGEKERKEFTEFIEKKRINK